MGRRREREGSQERWGGGRRRGGRGRGRGARRDWVEGEGGELGEVGRREREGS